MADYNLVADSPTKLQTLDLKVGFSCNNNCIFCAQAHRKHMADYSTEENKLNILKSYKAGRRRLVFTGGEPTLRADLVELVSYAKKLGYEVIQLQTNARMLSYKPLCIKLLRAGLNEVSPALHGSSPEIHDFHTRVKGSFNQTVQGIKNLVALRENSNDLYLCSNSVITRYNYRDMPSLAHLLVNLGVDQFQLAFMHAVTPPSKKLLPKKSLVKPYIHRALDVGIAANVKCMVEAYPYCFMRGYEKHVSQQYIPDTEIRGTETYIENYAEVRRTQDKIKFKKCASCIYNKRCEGPWKEYPEVYGDSEFVPMKC